jgi:hypothetical protein
MGRDGWGNGQQGHARRGGGLSNCDKVSAHRTVCYATIASKRHNGGTGARRKAHGPTSTKWILAASRDQQHRYELRRRNSRTIGNTLNVRTANIVCRYELRRTQGTAGKNNLLATITAKRLKRHELRRALRTTRPKLKLFATIAAIASMERDCHCNDR